MRTLIAVLALIVCIVAPGFIAAASAAPRNDQSAQSSGTYRGYPLSDWYHPDKD